MPTEDPVVGCILLEEPFFVEERDWIPTPVDFKGPTQVGKSYDMESGTGLMLWRQITLRLIQARIKTLGPATVAAQEGSRFGKTHVVAPRLGQGSLGSS